MIEQAIIFVIALAVLAKSSQLVINASIKIAEHFKVAELAVGYLLIAISTSIPDFMVSVTAALTNRGAIALGDVFGSSIANISLVLGVAALLKGGIKIEKTQTLESSELLLLMSIIPLILLSKKTIEPLDGFVLLGLFVLYCFFVLRKRFSLELRATVTASEWKKSLATFFVGIALVIVSAHFVVESAASIARLFNLSEAFIGLSIVAFGTTLPELAIDFTAIRRGHTALAVGDVLGAAAVNLTLVLGTAAIFTPLYGGILLFTTAISYLVGMTVFLWYVLMKHDGISKRQGLILVIAYLLFMMVEANFARVG